MERKKAAKNSAPPPKNSSSCVLRIVEEDIGDTQAAKPEQLNRDIRAVNQEYEEDNGGRNADQRPLDPADGPSTRLTLAGLRFLLVLFRGEVLFQVARGDAHRLLLAGGPLSEPASFPQTPSRCTAAVLL